MRRPKVGDRVRFMSENDVIEGKVVVVDVRRYLLQALDDNGKRWYVGRGDVLVVEEP